MWFCFVCGTLSGLKALLGEECYHEIYKDLFWGFFDIAACFMEQRLQQKCCDTMTQFKPSC